MAQGIVRIKKGREKPIRNRHPWIFSGAVAHAENAVDGEMVTVVDHQRRFLARGYWNSRSQIQVRIMTWQDETIDDGWWLQILSRAISQRDDPGSSSKSARRLINAENDFVPGLIIDRYADTCVLQALTLYIDKHKARIAEALSELTGAACVFERSDVDARSREGLGESVGPLFGETPPDLVDITEGDSTFRVDIKRGHKTGFYLDQRDNRHVLANLVSDYAERASEPIKLLNLFSYTGGFAVSVGRFDDVYSVNVDSSRAALELADLNFKHNGYDRSVHGDNAEFIQADGFDYLRHCVDEGELYDLVALDPPKFAHHKSQVQRAARGYKDLNLKALKLVKAGGFLMTFSCSGGISRDLFQKIVFGALVDSGRQAQVVKQLSAAADHPVALTFPEGEYLKGLLLRVF